MCIRDRFLGKVERLTHVIDARGEVLGRIASRASNLLMGKHKPIYDPAVNCADHVVVTNAKDVVLTGNKLKQKLYRYHTGWMGGLVEKQAKTVMRDTPERVIEAAVTGMLPKNAMRRQRMRHLQVFPGDVPTEQ
eukprot:TRINITY_DN11507_c0_g1_i2.p2 TRINITY_DN11507_c0_g1~~TRINITY_DN11507_c0_g1_i2.p2  ORF type:complete len:134 (+),score=29.81 TRINITY_DN11507_c0_g1_i2:78-479(+)